MLEIRHLTKVYDDGTMALKMLALAWLMGNFW